MSTHRSRIAVVVKPKPNKEYGDVFVRKLRVDNVLSSKSVKMVKDHCMKRWQEELNGLGETQLQFYDHSHKPIEDVSITIELLCTHWGGAINEDTKYPLYYTVTVVPKQPEREATVAAATGAVTDEVAKLNEKAAAAEEEAAAAGKEAAVAEDEAVVAEEEAAVAEEEAAVAEEEAAVAEEEAFEEEVVAEEEVAVAEEEAAVEEEEAAVAEEEAFEEEVVAEEKVEAAMEKEAVSEEAAMEKVAEDATYDGNVTEVVNEVLDVDAAFEEGVAEEEEAAAAALEQKPTDLSPSVKTGMEGDGAADRAPLSASAKRRRARVVGSMENSSGLKTTEPMPMVDTNATCTTWPCAKCTFENDKKYAMQCEMCKTKRTENARKRFLKATKRQKLYVEPIARHPSQPIDTNYLFSASPNVAPMQ